MNVSSITYVYFLGIGGIGMSALARYFLFMGKIVSGYDRTKTPLTSALENEGISIHYEDSVDAISLDVLRNKENVLVVYTPAIPEKCEELQYLLKEKFSVKKRSEVLGLLTKEFKGIAIAGTHGKTSVTTMTTHLLHSSKVGCSAFLGGISKNYNTNFLFNEHSDYIVVEADEYDRSFHTLQPYCAVITSIDADHLDIYGTHAEIRQAFSEFTEQICVHGYLVLKKGILTSGIEKAIEKKQLVCHTYALEDDSADFYAKNIVDSNGFYSFDLVTPFGTIEGIVLGVSGKVNIENAIAASALALHAGVNITEIKEALISFLGVKRRFDYQIRTDSLVYIDDYAHHPAELTATIGSVTDLYKGKKVTGIFQPHLYSRTKDFADEFAEALSLLDELILLDIYPAREEPIPGVDSKMLFDKIKMDNKYLATKQFVLEMIDSQDIEVLLTMGAGDIDTLVDDIKNKLSK